MARSPLSPRPAAPPMPDAATQNLFEEIDQEVKAKQMNDFFKRYGTIMLTIIVGVVIGTAAFSTYSGMQAKQREVDSEKLIALMDKPADGVVPEELSTRIVQYDDLQAKTAGQGQRMLAAFASAGTLLRNGKTDEGVAKLKALSTDSSIREIYRDYATLMMVRARMDKENPEQLQSELKSLLNPSSAWYLSALETSAILYAKQGKYQEAVNQLNGIVQTQDAPVNVRERALQLTRLYSTKQ